jgi:hypothetical protein
MEIPVEGMSHPDPSQIERFMRVGGLPREEVRAIVRHLLTGCPDCVEEARRWWNLGSEPQPYFEEELAVDPADDWLEPWHVKAGLY